MTSYQPQPFIPQEAGTPPLEMPHYGISFGGAIARGFKKYATFTGRASRSEFWRFGLFTNLVAIASRPRHCHRELARRRSKPLDSSHYC